MTDTTAILSVIDNLDNQVSIDYPEQNDFANANWLTQRFKIKYAESNRSYYYFDADSHLWKLWGTHPIVLIKALVEEYNGLLTYLQGLKEECPEPVKLDKKASPQEHAENKLVENAGKQLDAVIRSTKKWLNYIQSDSGSSHILNVVAKNADVRIETPTLFNAKPNLLPLKDGKVFDIEDIDLRPITAEDMITHTTNLIFDDSEPPLECPNIKKFLETIFQGDEDKIEYIRQLMILTCFGYSKHNFSLFQGEGRNGKGTLIKLMHNMLGPNYATVITPDFLTTKEDKNYESGNLSGRHLVTTDEPREGARLQGSVIKRYTGADTVVMRKAGEKSVSAQTKFVLIMSVNERLSINGNDPALRNRTTLVTFNYTVPLEEQDPQIDSKLAAEMPGLFMWLIEGMTLFKQNGKKVIPAESLVRETDIYFMENNSLVNFCSDAFQASATSKTGYHKYQSRPLYHVYVKWYENQTVADNRFRLGEKKFGEEMKKIIESKVFPTYDRIMLDGRTYFKGFSLKPLYVGTYEGAMTMMRGGEKVADRMDDMVGYE